MKRNVEAFNNTIELLGEHLDSYDQGTFGRRDGGVIENYEYIDQHVKVPMCGTAFCIGGTALLANGWVAIFHEDQTEVTKFMLVTPTINYFVDATWAQMCMEVGHLLGLHDGEAIKLFDVRWTPKGEHTVLTALEAIRDGADPLDVGFLND